ncbi:MAG: PQQ-binding-like beta-propeller repeat protein [Myxococcota bacterium]
MQSERLGIELGRPVVAKPVVGPNAVWVGTVDGHVVCIDASGAVQARDVGAAVAATGCRTPQGSTVWPLVDGTVVALDAEGETIWRYDLTRERPTPTVLPTRAFQASLLSLPDGTVVAGSDDTHMYALHPDGTLAWAAALGLPIRGTPALTLDGGILVAGLDAMVTRLDSDTGRVRWRRNVGHAVLGGATTDEAGHAVVATVGGRVVALDVEKGRIVWALNIDVPMVARPLFTGAAWVVATLDGQVVRVSTAGQSLGSTPVDGPVCATPLLVDATILVGTTEGAVVGVSAEDGRLEGPVPLSASSVPRAISGFASEENGWVVVTSGGEVFRSQRGTTSPSRAPGEGAPTAEYGESVRLKALHLDEPALLGALDPLVGIGVQLDVVIFDPGEARFAVGRWVDSSDRDQSRWVLFDVEEEGATCRFTTSRLPLRIGSVPLSLAASFELAESASIGTWTVEVAPGLAVPDLALATLWVAHRQALIERAGKPFLAVRKAFEGLRTTALPTPTQIASQVRGLTTAAPRWLSALTGLADPSRWRTWRANADVRGGGRLGAEAWSPPSVPVVVDHVHFDTVRRHFVAEVADPRGQGLRPEDLLIVLVRAGRRVEVDVARLTRVTVRRGVVTDVLLELPLDLVVDLALHAWVLVGQRVVWRGPVLGSG